MIVNVMSKVCREKMAQALASMSASLLPKQVSEKPSSSALLIDPTMFVGVYSVLSIEKGKNHVQAVPRVPVR